MSHFLTSEQEMIRDVASRFARSEVEPVASIIDQQDAVPETVHQKTAELNLFGLFTPEEFGGLGQNLTTACVALEEIAKASPSYAGMLSVEMILCPAAIALTGTEAQKQRYLVPSAQGRGLLAWSQTEPGGAANTPAHQTRLTEDGAAYRLNGLKLFCTQGRARTVMVMAKTRQQGRDGYGCALVDIGAPGVEPARYESKLGWRGTNTGAIAYNNVLVARDEILGDLVTGNADLSLANFANLIGHSATSVGCAQGMFDKTLAFVKQRSLYGKPMYTCQPVSYWLSEAYAKLQAMRSLIYATSQRWDAGQRDILAASTCKAWICDTAFDVTHRLLQLWGGSGIMDSTGVNRYFRDARTNMVAEASSEMHYDIVAAHLLGKSMFGSSK